MQKIEPGNLTKKAQQSTENYPRRRAFLVTALLAPGAGLAASLMAVVTMGILFFVAGTPSPPASPRRR